ncbi:MAG TPA: GAF domain-containing sensor histidine kinase [bacterium]|nr:GAF domain-containing sensor histidine kinase [bacterium]
MAHTRERRTSRSARSERAGADAPSTRPVDELKVLNAIAEALNRSPDVQQALERTLRLVASLLGLRTGWVWLLDPDTQQFYSAAAQNLPPYLQEPVRMTGASCWCIEEFRSGDLTPKNIDVIECSRLRAAVKKKAVHLTQGLRNHASIPLYFQKKPLGIMNVTGPSWRRLSPGELRLLSTIAYQVGIAIERARLAEESARLARTRERARIAREIHDTLAQGLTAIALHLEGAMASLDGSPARARERLQRALDVSRESLEEARRSVLDLRAAPLADTPLGDALVALGRRFTSETGVRVRVRAAVADPLPDRVEAEMLRIAQEALANVRRHARAEEVRVALRRRGGRVRLTIRDDGQGFLPGASPGGFGIVGMRERARLLGGTLRVGSRPGRGTAVEVSVPVGQATR